MGKLSKMSKAQRHARRMMLRRKHPELYPSVTSAVETPKVQSKAATRKATVVENDAEETSTESTTTEETQE